MSKKLSVPTLKFITFLGQNVLTFPDVQDSRLFDSKCEKKLQEAASVIFENMHLDIMLACAKINS